MKALQPPGWPRPKGYANGVTAQGRLVFVAGQVGWGPDERFASADFVDQARQALTNIVAVLREAGAGPEHVTRLTRYVVDKREYLARLPELGQAYRAVMGAHFPAMTAVEVKGLVEEGARVEIEATAIVPGAA
jgi:enamine deaminase RidA (YjgF/YER057c/UK114 family)